MDPASLTSDPELRAVARRGRELARRVMPPGPLGWIEALSELAGPPDLVWGVCGAIAGGAVEFERAFQRGGAHVRELIFAWHKVIREPHSPYALPGETGAFERWLRGRMGEARPDAREWRAVFYQWVDVASERLTQRHYPREEDRARHARALLAGPLRLSGFDLPAQATEWLLRFHDLLLANEAGERGFNRLAPADGWGGFYGMSGGTPPVEEETFASVARELHRELTEKSAAVGLHEKLQAVVERIEADMRSAIATRIETGAWPEAFRMPEAAKRLRKPSLWRRLTGR